MVANSSGYFVVQDLPVEFSCSGKMRWRIESQEIGDAVRKVAQRCKVARGFPMLDERPDYWDILSQHIYIYMCVCLLQLEYRMV